MRDGPWKLLLNPDGSRLELYDLRTDHTQLNNVAGQHPDVVAQLRPQVLAWYQTLPESPIDPNAGQMNYRQPGSPAPAGPAPGKGKTKKK